VTAAESAVGAGRSVEDQLDGVLAGLEPLAPLELRLLDAYGCVLVEGVSSVPRQSASPENGLSGAAGPSAGVLPEGARLGATQVGLLAGLGYERVRVRPHPRVVVLSLGRELVEPGTQVEHEQQVLDANSYLLAAAAQEAGAVAFRVGIVPVDPRALLDAVEDQLLRADLVLLSGAISPEVRPVVEAALSRLGTVSFTDVALEPGQVQGMGRIGPHGTPVFLLSADPTSAYISFEVFVRPVIRKLLGAAPLHRRLVRAVCLEPLSVAAAPRTYLPGWLDVADGRYVVRPAGGAGTPPLAALAHCNALIVVSEEDGEVSAGGSVLVAVLHEAMP
jgi:molybdopterin molybdotransferase